jgi:hypothetical protein
MIPELFPRTKASAMAIYNLAIHAGRAVSFASGAFLGVPFPDIPDMLQGIRGGASPAAALLDGGDAAAAAAVAAAAAAGNIVTMPDGVILLPLSQLSDLASLGTHTILYMTADALVLAPSAAMDVLSDIELKLGLTWRDIFTAVAAPGLLLSPVLMLTVVDPGRRFSGSRMMRRKARSAAAPRKVRVEPAAGESGGDAVAVNTLSATTLAAADWTAGVGTRSDWMAGANSTLPIQSAAADAAAVAVVDFHSSAEVEARAVVGFHSSAEVEVRVTEESHWSVDDSSTLPPAQSAVAAAGTGATEGSHWPTEVEARATEDSRWSAKVEARATEDSHWSVDNSSAQNSQSAAAAAVGGGGRSFTWDPTGALGGVEVGGVEPLAREHGSEEEDALAPASTEPALPALTAYKAATYEPANPTP